MRRTREGLRGRRWVRRPCALSADCDDKEEGPSIWGKGHPAINPNTAQGAVPWPEREHRPGRRRRGQKRRHVGVDGPGRARRGGGGIEGKGGRPEEQKRKKTKKKGQQRARTTTRTWSGTAQREDGRGSRGEGGKGKGKGKGAGRQGGQAGRAGGRDEASLCVARRQWQSSSRSSSSPLLSHMPPAQHRQHAQSRRLRVLPVGQAEVHPRGPAAVRQMQAERAGRRVRVPR